MRVMEIRGADGLGQSQHLVLRHFENDLVSVFFVVFSVEVFVASVVMPCARNQASPRWRRALATPSRLASGMT